MKRRRGRARFLALDFLSRGLRFGGMVQMRDVWAALRQQFGVFTSVLDEQVATPAPGYTSVTTHIFDSQNEYLDSDTVFGVRDSLIAKFEPATADDPLDLAYVVDVDFVLAPS